MKNVSIGPLSKWDRVPEGEVIDFPVPETSGVRTVQFEVNSAEPVTVRAFTPERQWLLATVQGHYSIKFVTHESVGVSFFGSPEVFVKLKDEPQFLDETGEPTFTVIEPLPSQQSDQFQRVFRMMELNRIRREKELQSQLDHLRDRVNATASMDSTQAGQEAPQGAKSTTDGGEGAETLE